MVVVRGLGHKAPQNKLPRAKGLKTEASVCPRAAGNID